MTVVVYALGSAAMSGRRSTATAELPSGDIVRSVGASGNGTSVVAPVVREMTSMAANGSWRTSAYDPSGVNDTSGLPTAPGEAAWPSDGAASDGPASTAGASGGGASTPAPSLTAPASPASWTPPADPSTPGAAPSTPAAVESVSA